MKYIKYGIIAIFIVITILFTINWFKEKNSTDNNRPTIEMDKDIIEVSVKDGDEELLKGVIAKDKEDGDISAEVIVESISQFVDKENHICNVTYAVADSDNNVVKITRKVKFTDYRSPRFTLLQPLCFNVGDDLTTTAVLGATDDRDGDISNKVKLLASTVYTGTAGEYTITAQVTNSLGDTSKLKATVIIRQGNNLSPVITLTDNIVYIAKGEDFDPYKYIKTVKDNEDKAISTGRVDIVSSTVDNKKEGTYAVEFLVTDDAGNEGSTYLTVVVEE